jgi:hypothetical protein
MHVRDAFYHTGVRVAERNIGVTGLPRQQELLRREDTAATANMTLVLAGDNATNPTPPRRPRAGTRGPQAGGGRRVAACDARSRTATSTRTPRLPT